MVFCFWSVFHRHSCPHSNGHKTTQMINIFLLNMCFFAAANLYYTIRASFLGDIWHPTSRKCSSLGDHPLCDVHRDINHIFFYCVTPSSFGDTFGKWWVTVDDVLITSLTSARLSWPALVVLVWYIGWGFRDVYWTIRTITNKLVFERIHLQLATNGIFKLCVFLQQRKVSRRGETSTWYVCVLRIP